MMYVLDTCVLFPTVVRNILLKLALSGEFQPVWSQNIIEEWIWSSKKNGMISTESAKVEIMQTKLIFPNSLWNLEEINNIDYWLPDLDDIHVLALAIQSKSKGIITFNKKDFPNSILGKYDLFSVTPDQFILEIFKVDSNLVFKICNSELDDINKTFEKKFTLKSLLKKAHLPKLAKVIS
jgi:predicted nucleic acid-binding protein